MTPQELILEAKQKGLSGLSITDHDTIAAYTPNLIDFANKQEIFLLTGVEISSILEYKSVHILGYGVNVFDPVFLKFLIQVQKNRKKRNDEILQKLRAHKMPITYEDMHVNERRSFVLGRPHIAMAMVKKGFVKFLQEAFDRYLKDNASCYVEGNKVSVEEVIQEIHRAGGKAVLAHPHFYKNAGLIRKLLDCPFDGIEGYYSKMPAQHEKKWIDIGKSKQWIVTGGSDFHGSIKPHIQLGCSWVGKEVIEELLSKEDKGSFPD